MRALQNQQPVLRRREKSVDENQMGKLPRSAARQSSRPQGLRRGKQLAKQRKRKGMTQAELAKKIGTSTPQLSRTERRPENVNMRTLIRYAEAVGMKLDIRLVAKKT
jgi:DNA-binding XRE family transcriptional regulator